MVENRSWPSTWHQLDPETENSDVIASLADPDPSKLRGEDREGSRPHWFLTESTLHRHRAAYVQTPKGTLARKNIVLSPKFRISHSIPAMSGSPDPSPSIF